MRIALVVGLVLVLCTVSFAARPDRGRVTPKSTVDDGELVGYWPPNEPVAFQMEETELPTALGPQYHGVWRLFKTLWRMF